MSNQAEIEDFDFNLIQARSCLAWVTRNAFINENQKLFEFVNHRYMIDIYNDTSPELVCMKSAQVGFSVLAILKSIHAAKYLMLNVIYVLPTRNATHDFVIPKVNPMLDRNPKIKALLKNTDSVNLKQVGDRFLYFRGAFHRGEAISTTADLVISDEHDISDQQVLTIYQSRLQASEWGWFWRFSNPTLPSFGVHELYEQSDQMHWMVKCFHCKYEMYLDLDLDDQGDYPNHYVDRTRQIYACGACHREIYDDDRRAGRWVAKYPDRPMRGYWINQLMVPWVSAKKILKQEEDMDIDVFHNFVLGKPYQASEFVINGEAILNACKPGEAPKSDVIIGCDSGKIKHWVMGNPQGIFAYGRAKDWEEIEQLIVMYKATAVIDALPDFTVPEQLARKYPGQVYVHYYNHDKKDLKVTSIKEGENFGVLESDRTKLFDLFANRVSSGKLRFYQVPEALKQKNGLIYHFEQMYRVVELDKKNILRARWETKVGKPDHFAHAAVYYQAGLSVAVLSGETGGVLSTPVSGVHTTFAVDPETQTVPVEEALGRPLNDLVERSLLRNRKHRVN